MEEGTYVSSYSFNGPLESATYQSVNSYYGYRSGQQGGHITHIELGVPSPPNLACKHYSPNWTPTPAFASGHVQE